MTFQFRLHSILRMRQRERDKAAQSMQQAQLARQKLLDQLGELNDEMQRLIDIRSQASLGSVNVRQVLDAQRYQLDLMEKMRGTEVNIALIDQEIEKRRAKLVVCEQGVKVLEKLNDQQRDTWQAQQEARSQARLDEWASYQHFQRQAESD